MIYYLGQTCAILAWIIFLISTHVKRENKVIFFHILSAILYTINYLCLGAMIGFWISIFELIKAIGYYKTDKDKYIYFGTLPIYLILIYYYGFSFITLVAILGSVIDGYVLLKDKRTIVFGEMISYSLWIVYDLFFLDYAGVWANLFIVLSNIYVAVKGYSKYLNREDVYTIRPTYISKNTVNEIIKLDKQQLDKEYRWNLDKINALTYRKKYYYILVKDKNRIIGYVNFLNVKEDIYKRMIKSNKLYDDFKKSDLLNYTKNRKIYLNLNVIVLSSEYNNSDTIEKIVEAIRKYIRNMIKNRYFIQEICCYSVNHVEVEVLEKLGFKKVKEITKECYLYRKII